jgi:hypothetical protein
MSNSRTSRRGETALLAGGLPLGGIMAKNGKLQQNPERQLSPKQLKALDALLVAPSMVAAAAQAGCAERSIRN